MGKVLPFTGVTRLDLPPDRVLESMRGELEGVVIIGYNKEGGEVFASSYADGGTVLWLIERMKKKLLSVPEDLEG